MKIVRKFGITLAAAAVGFGLLGISAPAHAATASHAAPAHVHALDLTWGA